MPREAYTPGYDPSPSATPSVSFLGQSQNREMQEAPYEEEVEAPFDSKRPPLQFDPPRLLHSPKIAIEPFELREDRKKNAELRNRQRRAALGPDAWMPPRVAVIKPLSHPGTPNMSKRLAIRASAHELAASLRPTPMPSPSKKFFEDKHQAKPAKQVIPSYRLRVLAELLVFEPEFYKALKQASAEDVWVRFRWPRVDLDTRTEADPLCVTHKLPIRLNAGPKARNFDAETIDFDFHNDLPVANGSRADRLVKRQIRRNNESCLTRSASPPKLIGGREDDPKLRVEIFVGGSKLDVHIGGRCPSRMSGGSGSESSRESSPNPSPGGMRSGSFGEGRSGHTPRERQLKRMSTTDGLAGAGETPRRCVASTSSKLKRLLCMGGTGKGARRSTTLLLWANAPSHRNSLGRRENIQPVGSIEVALTPIFDPPPSTEASAQPPQSPLEGGPPTGGSATTDPPTPMPTPMLAHAATTPLSWSPATPGAATATAAAIAGASGGSGGCTATPLLSTGQHIGTQGTGQRPPPIELSPQLNAASDVTRVSDVSEEEASPSPQLADWRRRRRPSLVREVDEDLYRSDGLTPPQLRASEEQGATTASKPVAPIATPATRAPAEPPAGEEAKAVVPSEEEDGGLERRIDAADGGAYTLAEFREFYGGDKEWQAAERVGEGGVWDEAAAKLQAIARGRAARLKRRVPAEDAALDDYVRDVIEQAAAELDLEAEQKLPVSTVPQEQHLKHGDFRDSETFRSQEAQVRVAMLYG